MATIWSGRLSKMDVSADDDGRVDYRLVDRDPDGTAGVELALNDRIGRELRLSYEGTIECTACGRKTKKSFNQGFCWPCSQSRPEADICIVKPELCHFHQAGNPCRDDDFAHRVCFKPHVLYVSLTSGVKVGITRRVNVPSRWIDQGAVRAIPVAVLPDRFTVGKLEKRLAEDYADKTHWMRMLKESDPEGDPRGAADEIAARLEGEGVEGVLPAAERVERRFVYPVRTHPVKVKSFNLDKAPEAGGVLEGIKGQYLIFDTAVINLRKYTGYRVTIEGAA